MPKDDHFYVRNRTGAFSCELGFSPFSVFLVVFTHKTAWHICWQVAGVGYFYLLLAGCFQLLSITARTA